MSINSIKYISSDHEPENIKKLGSKRLFLIVGRSNVGKSTMINSISGKSIAKSSKKPGKTQCMNIYSIDSRNYFIDLPGFSFAHVSLEMRSSWDKMIRELIISYQEKSIFILIIDAKIGPKISDLDFLKMIFKLDVKIILVVNKIDRLNQSKRIAIIKEMNEFKIYYNLNDIIFISSRTGENIGLLSQLISNYCL